MAKLNLYRKISMLIMAVMVFTTASAQYRLEISGIDRSVSFISDTLKLQRQFPDLQSCSVYVNKLPLLLQAKGYLSASVDTVVYDTAQARCLLYVGEPVRHIHLVTDSVEPAIIEQTGILRKRKGITEIGDLQAVREKMLGYLEDNGYPFASVSADSIRFSSDSIYAVLKIDKGPLYKIDSIRNNGAGSISSGFLQQYLGIKNGSIYRRERLQQISGKIRELPYLQEKQQWNLSLLGTGSILNVYLDPRKSSEVNVLIGLLPANEQLASNKMLVTGEANINLKNALGGGEIIGLNWQQIQVKSPRLNILFQQPYLFGSPFGVNFNFDLLKKDSSYVNISLQLGLAYAVSSRQTGSVFIQRFTTNLLTVDTNRVKNLKQLPAEADMNSTSLGVNYEWLTTDYRFNPRRGNELMVNVSAGVKNIRKNNVIVKLTDNSDPSFDYNSLYDTFRLKSYQFRLKGRAAHYFPLGRASVIKAAFNGGWFQSPDIFRNELFQIGGYKMLRGFDEESIFASAYGVVTAEYRYLLGQNSFLSVFTDYGVINNRSLGRNLKNNFLGAGLGMSFETKAGIFNITYAAGKRDDVNFSLRQSKIHLGYVNYF